MCAARGLSGYEFMSELYRTERVSVLDGGAFGNGTAGFVRLCFATDEATLREAMRAHPPLRGEPA